MRSKTVLAVVWLISTVAAVTVVWQSLGFVTGTTASDGALGAGPVATVGAGAGSGAGSAPTAGDATPSSFSSTGAAPVDGTATPTPTGLVAPATSRSTSATTNPATSPSSTARTTTVPSSPSTTAPITAAPITAAPITAAPITAAPTTAAPAAAAVDQTFSTVGGTTAVRYANGGVTVLWATPAAGFTASIEPEHSGLRVEFRSDAHRSRVEVWWADGPRHDISEEAR